MSSSNASRPKDRAIELERAQNLWASFVRKYEPHARGTEFTADPAFDLVQ